MSDAMKEIQRLGQEMDATTTAETPIPMVCVDCGDPFMGPVYSPVCDRCEDASPHMDGISALLIAQALKGKWKKRPGERDTEKVKRIWRTMNRILNETKD